MLKKDLEHFGFIRSYLWPIHAHEVKKLIPMILMLFFICLNCSILRNLKDSIVITAKKSGAEVIPFIKVWAMLPAAIGSTVLFSYMSNNLSRKRVFEILFGTFLVFFLLFGIFIYPNRESLHPNDLANSLELYLPVGCKGLIAMFRNWTLTGFYTVSELWSSMILSVLYWGFINEITKISESGRFYSVMSIASNIAAILAGQISVFLTNTSYNPSLPIGNDSWDQSVFKITFLIFGSGVLTLFIYRWMHRNVLSNQDNLPESAQKIKKKEKKKLSFKESISYIAQSRYLLCIAIIVLSYNLVINLVEVIWKDRLRQLYPSPQDYNVYINNLTSAMGIISTTTSLLMAGILSRLGWTKTALLTPAVLCVTSIAFFSCLLADTKIAPVVSMLFYTTPLALAVLFGSIQNCFSKAAKYSLFDATKEMTFVPLSPEHKLKGKAAIDGIGSRLGKSGGSVIHQGFLLFFGTLSASAPYVAVVILFVLAAWIIAIRMLGHEFATFSKEARDQQDASDLVRATEKA
jgi:AAA family ATP:ADP antiporter